MTLPARIGAAGIRILIGDRKPFPSQECPECKSPMGPTKDRFPVRQDGRSSAIVKVVCARGHQLEMEVEVQNDGPFLIDAFGRRVRSVPPA